MAEEWFANGCRFSIWAYGHGTLLRSEISLRKLPAFANDGRSFVGHMVCMN